jgi:hypothetical protein
MKNKTPKSLCCLIAVLGFAFVVAMPLFESKFVIAGDNSNRICGDITFGTTTNDSDGTAVTIADLTTTNISVSSITPTKAFCKGSGYACRFGTGSLVGTLVFNFSSSYVITKIKVLAFEYGTDGAVSMNVQTSALSSALTQTISTVSAPDISNSSTDAGYVFTGLDGGSGFSSTSLTISSTSDRFYVAKIVLTIGGSSALGSSSSGGSVASTSSSGISSSGVSSGNVSSGSASSRSGSSSSSQSNSTYYRVAPKTSSTTSTTVYTVASALGSYYSTSVKTLTKGTYYTSYPDVAAYYQAFGEVPSNYSFATSSNENTVKAAGYTKYGESARLWFSYSRTDGYMTQVPQYNTSGGSLVYYEIDISSNWSSYSSNRGALRLMAMPFGCQEYGTDPVIFYTSDHYVSFYEYYNYSGGWGPDFTGRTDYVVPSTVTTSYA